MIPCATLIKDFFKDEDWKIKLLSEWSVIVGDLGDKMKLEEIKNDMLVIGVYESAWLQELYLLSSVIKKIINQALGENKIKTLRFKYAAFKPPVKIKKTLASPTNVEYHLIILNSKEAHALQTIKDQELRIALHTFLSSCHYRKLLQ